MQINIQNSEVGQESFFFEPIPNKILQQKQTKEILTKWGLAETLKIGSFRYNQLLQDYEINRFLHDLFNNPNVRFVMNNIKFAQQSISTVQFERMRCHELTLELFDQFEKEQIVKKGYIAKMISEYHEDIQICDKIRECLIVEQSESYCIFNQAQRKQLLFRLFQLLVIGGSFNQYEDLIQPYLDWTKKIYKSIVSVKKRSQTGQIFSESMFFEIKSMDGGKSYKKGYNPQNIIYVIINPSIRTVHIVGNDWKKFW